MSVVKCPAFLLLIFLSTCNRGDAEVCVLNSSCILTCSFQPGDDLVIHWVQVEGNVPVHAYYYNNDQLSLQHQRFRGRTSLFKGQISRGNASLQLTGVDVQDQGKYKCYTSTITGSQKSFIDVKVEAPVHKVDIEQVENRITCSAEGIYPEPELTWSTSPASNVILSDRRTVEKTEQQLYNISSSLILSGSAVNQSYSCTVSAGRNRRTATLFKPTSINSTGTETTIHCTASDTPLTSLIWRFNHNQIILSQTRAGVPYTVSEEWERHVKDVSESGNLILQRLSSNQEGVYTCELSNAEETYVTNTFLRIETSQGKRTAGIIAGVGVIAFIVMGGVLLMVLMVCKKKLFCKKSHKESKTDTEEVETALTNQPEKENTSFNSMASQSSAVKCSVTHECDNAT